MNKSKEEKVDCLQSREGNWAGKGKNDELEHKQDYAHFIDSGWQNIISRASHGLLLYLRLSSGWNKVRSRLGPEGPGLTNLF